MQTQRSYEKQMFSLIHEHKPTHFWQLWPEYDFKPVTYSKGQKWCILRVSSLPSKSAIYNEAEIYVCVYTYRVA